ncbi:MAG TPA: response regulator [Nitrospira sp.]|nr:response regulator [Nitrospira sp.]
MEGYGRRILVAEDDENIRAAVADLLAKAGYNVFAVEDGLAALQEIKKRHFDVILTDYQMPRLNGLELLALCHELVPATPVIIVSAADPSIERIATERGAFAWIRKPTPLAQVLVLLRQAMTCPQSDGEEAELPAQRSMDLSLPLKNSVDLVAGSQ